jgi:hypothetical protein
MHERHTDRELYFREQSHTTRKHVIPFISGVSRSPLPYRFWRSAVVREAISFRSWRQVVPV